MIEILAEYKYWRDIAPACWRAIQESMKNGPNNIEKYIFYNILVYITGED